ncbi:MAG TPA: serine/threonine protein kinase, partial [Gemmatimonadota bacterium]|nr:serine/threonine protein kinase [Gemmatimonadota bacterium]
MSEARDPAFADELAPEFEVVRRIGRGSVADLFLGREVALKRLVALKVLRPEIARDETARKRFIREGRSAARIKHPNVVGLHRVGSLSD